MAGEKHLFAKSSRPLARAPTCAEVCVGEEYLVFSTGYLAKTGEDPDGGLARMNADLQKNSRGVGVNDPGLGRPLSGRPDACRRLVDAGFGRLPGDDEHASRSCGGRNIGSFLGRPISVP